jgi:putative PIN family toxin of toxin-antitoxin system
VLDTNVLLSALFTRGVCEAVLDACVDSDACTIVVSEHILDEVRRNASEKFGAPADDVNAAVDFLRRHADVVVPASMPADACRDPDDRPVLGTAVAGRADVLVTGDAELLALQRIKGIPILSPRAFYDRLR